MGQGRQTSGELTFAEIAEEVERAFGEGSVGLGGEACGATTEVARAIERGLAERHGMTV